MGSEREEFDDIVRGLDLNLSFPDDNDLETQPEDVPDSEPHELNSAVDESDQMLPGDDLWYRQPPAAPVRPWNLTRVMAVIGVVAGPLLLMIATMTGVVLARPVAYGLALIFVACAVWLIAQLPERGPGRPDSPDDGAEL